MRKRELEKLQRAANRALVKAPATVVAIRAVTRVVFRTRHVEVEEDFDERVVVVRVGVGLLRRLWWWVVLAVRRRPILKERWAAVRNATVVPWISMRVEVVSPRAFRRT